MRALTGPPRFVQVPDTVPPGAAAGIETAPNPLTGAPYENPQTMGAYVNPREAEARLAKSGKTAEQIRAAAMSYLQGQLKLYSRVAPLIGDEQFSMYAASLPINKDLRDLYRRASARLTELARAHGYADPRVYLRELARRSRQSAVPTRAPE